MQATCRLFLPALWGRPSPHYPHSAGEDIEAEAKELCLWSVAELGYGQAVWVLRGAVPRLTAWPPVIAGFSQAEESCHFIMFLDSWCSPSVLLQLHHPPSPLTFSVIFMPQTVPVTGPQQFVGILIYFMVPEVILKYHFFTWKEKFKRPQGLP